MKKIRVGILFGGKSPEHEVSLQSAKSVIDAIDTSKYDIIPIGITKKGQWCLTDESRLLLNADNPKLIKLNSSVQKVSLLPGETAQSVMSVAGDSRGTAVDVVFPVLHGPYGEDGTIQGLLKLLGVPFVGPSVLGAAVGMDKDVMKRLLMQANIPTPRFIAVTKDATVTYKKASEELGASLFVKPANLGSSVGVSKVENEKEFRTALDAAFDFDLKVLIEEAVIGREIECSVLGNDEPIASVPGEVIAHHDFYSYEAKYIDENGAALEIPAKLDAGTIARVQELAIKAFKTLCLTGMARADFFVRGDEVMVNELNTIPGFTKISMYPKLWEASGISYPELIDRLIQLALEQYKKESTLRTFYSD